MPGLVPVAGVDVLLPVVPPGVVPVVDDVPLPLVAGAPELAPGVAAGVDCGNEVSGVGSGGNGFRWAVPLPGSSCAAIPAGLPPPSRASLSRRSW